jgi:hypothetical protein
MDAGRKFAAEIAKAGAKAVLYQTWIRQPETNWYRDADTASFMKNPEYMRAQLHFNTSKLAKTMDADIVPVGDIWLQVLKEYPAIGLYQGDGSHPSPAGTYLAALLFYEYFSGHDVRSISFAPGGLSNDDASKLRMITAQHLQTSR